MRELLDDIRRWREEGEDVVVATVVGTRRSAPRPVGSSFAVSRGGALCGSVSGGCVESAIVQEAEGVFETGKPKLLTYGISDDEGWNVGLPCGGEIDVFVEKVE
jgi:xanthine dehydrogenase accessory factor